MKIRALALALILLAGARSRADLYIKEAIQQGGDAAGAETVHIYATPTSMRIEEPSGEVILLRSDKDVAWYLDAGEKAYIEVPLAKMITDMSAQQKAYDESLERMDETIRQMEATPDVPKETIEELRRERAKLEVVVTDLGKEDVAARPCARMRIAQGDDAPVEVWTATDLANADEIAKFNLYRFAREDWGVAWTRVKGVPLKVCVYADDGSIERKTEALVVAEKPIDPGLFEPPAGYRKVSQDAPPRPGGHR